MSIIKLLNLIKSKAGMAAIAGALILAPSGVALAHGNDGGNNNNRASHSQSGDRNHRGNDDKRKNDDRHKKDKDNNNQSATCEERQANANQKVADYTTRAQQRYNGLSLYLSNQQAFVESNNLAIENYAELSQDANDAKTKTADAFGAVQAPAIDCSQPEKKDGEVIGNSIHELRKALKRFESSTQKLSETIADKIVVS